MKIIVNARNFGPGRSPHHAMLATSGDAVAADSGGFGHATSRLPEMVRHWAAGSKVVIAVRRNSDERGLMVLARRAFYALIKRFSKLTRFPNFIGYGLYDRQVMDVIRSLNEPIPFPRARSGDWL